MILRDIYEKDINRPINPAVVVGERDEEHINQEIKEYVFSPSLLDNLYRFLNAVVNKKEGKPGIWITGYYGSGKSHFIKYCFYCINEKTRDMAFDHLMEAGFGAYEAELGSDATRSNMDVLRRKLGNLSIKEVLFNIAAVSRDRNRKDAITRILFNQLNIVRGYNSLNIALALLVEKHLDKRGLFDKFKEKVYESLGAEWNSKNIGIFIGNKLSQVIDVVYSFDNQIDKDALRSSVKNDREYSVEELVQELDEYTEDQGENYKLLFMIDEVSQYVGHNTDLLINLQSIIEGIGTQLNNKVWLACTAQLELKDLADNMETKTEEFGKIMGRFETRISMDSQDAAWITQKRILEKGQEGLKQLTDFYTEHKNEIANQFVFGHELYPNFKDDKEFYLVYPFIPYQFRLITDVLRSFNKYGLLSEGLKDTERAILGITHFTAQTEQGKDIGYFISFDNFFNRTFYSNLSNRAGVLIDKARMIDFGDDRAFALRVIHVLFMVSNLDDLSRINFPPTVENLTILLINDLKTVKAELQQKVQKVLDTLEQKNIIQANEGKYRFLDDEEIVIATEIKNTAINSATRLDYFYDQIIQKILKPDASVSIGGRSVKVGIMADDKTKTTGNATFNVRFLLFDKNDLYQTALQMPGYDLIIAINQWLDRSSDFKKEFTEYCKTARYLSENKISTQGERYKKMQGFEDNNTVRIRNLRNQFEKNFAETPIISQQQVITDTDTVSGSGTPASRYRDFVNYHLKGIYKNNEWAQNYPQSNAALKSDIDDKLKMAPPDLVLNIAEQEVDNKIKRAGDELSLGDLIKEFEQPPYGWRDLVTIDIVFDLAYRKYRTVEYINEELDLKNFFDISINSRNRDQIIIKKPKDYDPQKIESFKQSAGYIFPTFSFNGKDLKAQIEEFNNFLTCKFSEVKGYQEEYGGYPFSGHFKEYSEILSEIKDTRSSEKLMVLVVNKKDELIAQRDTYASLKDFVDQNFEQYKKIRAFIIEEKGNLKKLDEVKADDVRELERYFNTDDRPENKFPLLLKTYKNLKTALSEKIKTMRDGVMDKYTRIFGELELKGQELKIDEPNVIADKDYKLQKIKETDDIAQLEILDLQAGEFKIEELHKLYNFGKAASEDEGDVAYKEVQITESISGKTLNSKEDVESFISDLRKKLLDQLKENGKIFLR